MMSATARLVVSMVLVAAVVACRALTGTPPATVTVEAPLGRGNAPGGRAAPAVPLPNRADSLKFAVLGDFGTGGRSQYQLAAQMDKLHQTFPFELIILVGDNMYGSERAADFR